jgi:heptaprenyl diphosphate synthase
LKSHQAVRTLTITALLFAMAIALSLFEGLLPPIPSPVPLKYGLSNIAIMYALFFLGPKSAFTIAVLKSTFIIMTRGLFAGLVSIGGGLLSVLVMYLLYKLSKARLSYLLISVAGAIFHNAGQLFVAMVILNMPLAFGYIVPLMALTGVGTGILSAVLLKLIIPALAAIPGHKEWMTFASEKKAQMDDELP